MGHASFCLGAANQVQSVLGGGPTAWSKYGPSCGVPWPGLQALLVFIGSSRADMDEAADAAAACGYEHVAILQGSLAAFAEPMNDQVGAVVGHQSSAFDLAEQLLAYSVPAQPTGILDAAGPARGCSEGCVGNSSAKSTHCICSRTPPAEASGCSQKR